MSGASGAQDHEVEDEQDNRTRDVVTAETLQYNFDNLFLSPTLVAGLKVAGFHRPSPVQLHAIPVAKFGTDLIVQAKAGTGKTLVFTIVILESIQFKPSVAAAPVLQAVIVAPTREITLQIAEVMRTVGSGFPELRVGAFIGGVSQKEDKAEIKAGCQVAAGSPGRLYHLIRDGVLDVSNVSIAVLDEADKVTEGVFYQTVSHILAKFPERKQVMALSATYSSRLNKLLGSVTKNPHVIRVDDQGRVSNKIVAVSNNTRRSAQSSDEVFAALHGVKQLVFILPTPSQPEVVQTPLKSDGDAVLARMTDVLLLALENWDFRQCMVFCNDRRDTEVVCDSLLSASFPATFISAHITQTERIAALTKFRNGSVRVLVTSDLTARGIDVATVNLVVNLGLPRDTATYMHRIGRAGRFGSFGRALSIILPHDRARMRALEHIQGLKFLPASFGSDVGSEGVTDDSTPPASLRGGGSASPRHVPDTVTAAVEQNRRTVSGAMDASVHATAEPRQYPVSKNTTTASPTDSEEDTSTLVSIPIPSPSTVRTSSHCLQTEDEIFARWLQQWTQ